jgi:hypothetical protein
MSVHNPRIPVKNLQMPLHTGEQTEAGTVTSGGAVHLAVFLSRKSASPLKLTHYRSPRRNASSKAARNTARSPERPSWMAMRSRCGTDDPERKRARDFALPLRGLR